MKKIFQLLLIIHCSLLIVNAQWQADFRLTNNTAASRLSYNNARCLATSGDTIHIVWYDLRNGGSNSEIYYKRAVNNGANWSSDIRLTNNTAASNDPSIAIYSGIIHVIWYDNRDGNSEIYYKKSTDGGTNWGTDTRLTNNSAGSGEPSLSLSGSVLHVTWSEQRDGNQEIYYKRSTNNGTTWEPDVRLTNHTAHSAYSTVWAVGSTVHVAWHDKRDVSDEEIYYKRSTNDGVNWGNDIRLTINTSGHGSYYPSIFALGSIVHVVWMDTRNGYEPEIYYKRSADDGSNWGTDTRLTNNSGYSDEPFITASGPMVHVVWVDTRNSNHEIYYTRSTNNGSGWDPDTRLTNNSASSDNPFISASGSYLHVIWRDDRDLNDEIYTKYNPTGNITSIKNINSEVPESFILYQNYPNPFNPVTKIKFDVPTSNLILTPSTRGKGLTVMLTVYDILGREIEVLVNEQLQPGTYEVEWDAGNYASGLYYYSLITDDYLETRKMVYVK